MGSIKSNTGEQIHCSPVCYKKVKIKNKRIYKMKNTEKRRLGLYLALYIHRIFFRPTIVIASILAVTNIFI